MLTAHQNDIETIALQILERNNRLLIKGSAGVGKTFMVNDLLFKLRKKMGNVITYVAAPTHKALSVLRGKVNEFKNLEFVTVQSALKLKRKVNNATGEITFVPNFDPRYPPLEGVKIFVIDEASMVNSDLLGWIENYAKMFKVKVIFLGDDKQINPVGEEKSPVFYQDYPEVELTEIIRQGEGNPIIDLSRNLHWLDHKDHQKWLNDFNHGYLFSSDIDRHIRSLAEVNGTDELKYLAYHNKVVDNINFRTRQMIYTNPNKIELGETLVFNAPYTEKFFTNQEVRVEEIDKAKINIGYIANSRGSKTIKTIDLNVYITNPGSVQINEQMPKGIVSIHEESEEDYKKLIDFLANQAKFRNIKWTEYYAFIEQFADLKYNHAITVHKS